MPLNLRINIPVISKRGSNLVLVLTSTHLPSHGSSLELSSTDHLPTHHPNPQNVRSKARRRQDPRNRKRIGTSAPPATSAHEQSGQSVREHGVFEFEG